MTTPGIIPLGHPNDDPEVITDSDIERLRELLADGDRLLASNIAWVISKLPILLDVNKDHERTIKTLSKRCERAKDKMWALSDVLTDAQTELRLCREKDGAGPYDPTLKTRVAEAIASARRGLE